MAHLGPNDGDGVAALPRFAQQPLHISRTFAFTLTLTLRPALRACSSHRCRAMRRADARWVWTQHSGCASRRAPRVLLLMPSTPIVLLLLLLLLLLSLVVTVGG